MKDPTDFCVVDIETNGLLEDGTEIHCIVLYSGSAKEYFKYHDHPEMGVECSGPIAFGIERIMAHERVVMHNGAAFDVPFIEKITGEKILGSTELYDTMLMSFMRYPSRPSHSLDSWGKEMGVPKPEHEDWSTFSPEMLARCKEDVRITVRLHEKLLISCDGKIPLTSLALEQRVAEIHSRQAVHGVRFDIRKAQGLYDELESKRSSLAEHIISLAPWKCTIPGVALIHQAKAKERRGFIKFIAPFRQDGDYTVNTKKYFIGYAEDCEWSKAHLYYKPGLETVLGPYTKVTLEPLSLGNSGEVKDFLLSLGWEPTEYNHTIQDGRKVPTSPKLTEDSYDSIPTGLGKDIATYNMMSHRSRFIFNPEAKGGPKGALTKVRHTDLRVAADALTCATPTSRYRHMGTVCNIPRPSSAYGEEIRSLFCSPEGDLMLGLDLSGIEARCLAHYISPYPGGPELAKIITDGDFHQHNADLWGVSRDHAKSGLYALTNQRM